MLRRIIMKARRIKDRLQAGEDLGKASGRYWHLSEVDERIQDQSHWCGVRRWDRDRWLEHGDFYCRLALGYLTRFASADFVQSLSRRTALEWGCGGGAITRPLCLNFGSVFGVDISKATVEECKEQMSRAGLGNFKGIFFPADNPEEVLKAAGEASVDFILSIAVFQHFPSKPYTQRVLKVMASLLKDGGFALIQVRYFDGSPKLRQKDGDYSQNVIYMTSFTVEEFSDQLRNAGLAVLERARDVEGSEDRHDYYFIRKCR